MPRSRNPYTGGVTQRHPRPQGWLSRTHKKGRPWFRRARLSFLRWRRFIMSNPQTAFVYRWFVGCVGGTVIVIGLILVGCDDLLLRRGLLCGRLSFGDLSLLSLRCLYGLGGLGLSGLLCLCSGDILLLLVLGSGIHVCGIQVHGSNIL